MYNQLFHSSKQDSEHNIIKSNSLLNELEQKGVAKFQLISQSQIEELSDYFEYLDASSKMDYGGFYNTSDSFGKEKNREIHEKIQSVISNNLSEFFKDFSVHLSYFFVKPPSKNSPAYPHQDWYFVEPKYPSFNLWVPLKDITAENGALSLLHGSHHFNKDINPAPAGSVDWSLSKHSETLMKHMTVYEMKAGEALIFYTSTIHSSLPNSSTNTRIALGMGITHESAERIMYYTLPKQSKDKDNIEIAKCSIPKDHCSYCGNAKMWEYFNNGALPLDTTIIDTLQYNVPTISKEEVMEVIKKHKF